MTFHDGEALTSSAVKESIEAAATRGGASFIWAQLKSIDTPDPLTVVIHMKSPSRVDLIASSEDGAWIVCPSAVAAEAKDTNYFESGKDCGTGPYMLKSYSAGSQVVLQAYSRYWRGWTASRYQAVVIEITPEAIVQQQMLTSGQIDLALSLPAENIKKLTSGGKYSLLVRNTSENYIAFFNTTRPPLDNVLVRRALSYAIAVLRHHQGRRLRPWNAVARAGAEGHLPVDGEDAAIPSEPRPGESSCWRRPVIPAAGSSSR